jgi:hypothetical protein
VAVERRLRELERCLTYPFQPSGSSPPIRQNAHFSGGRIGPEGTSDRAGD